MFSKSALAVVSVVATTVLAQSYPSDLSESCLNFYKAFDADTSFKACTSALNDATSGYSNSSSAPTKDSITSTLKTICSPANTNDQCSDSAIRSKLADFATACKTEFEAKRADVISTYDSIYVYKPLKDSLCAKDDAGNSCVTQSSTYASQNPGLTDGVKQQLFSSPNSPTNYTAMGDANVVFLFLNPGLESGALCTVCTRNILTAYQTFATTTPHAAGLANSPLMHGMPELFSAVGDKCGPSFLNAGQVQGVAGLGTGSKKDKKNSGVKVRGVDVVALVAGVVSTVAVAAYL